VEREESSSVFGEILTKFTVLQTACSSKWCKIFSNYNKYFNFSSKSFKFIFSV